MGFHPLNGRMSTALRAFRFPYLILAPLALWLLTMISLPIVGWVWGEDALLRGMSVGVVMQAGAVMVILYSAWGWKPSLRVVLLVAVSTYLAELLGSKTGFPFGRYQYTDLLQPQLMGVPLLIPLAWLMMLPPAWAIAALILQRQPGAAGQEKSFVFPLKFALLSALAITAWDLFLDPQMVGWGFWVWEKPGPYFGIPISNYFGWILTAFLVTVLVRPRELPTRPLALVYGLTWLLQTIGQGIFWGQPGPAAIGFLACGAFVFLAWRRMPRSG